MALKLHVECFNRITWGPPLSIVDSRNRVWSFCQHYPHPRLLLCFGHGDHEPHPRPGLAMHGVQTVGCASDSPHYPPGLVAFKFGTIGPVSKNKPGQIAQTSSNHFALLFSSLSLESNASPEHWRNFFKHSPFTILALLPCALWLWNFVGLANELQIDLRRCSRLQSQWCSKGDPLFQHGSSTRPWT